MDHRAYKPYTLVGPPALRLVLDPLAVIFLDNCLYMIVLLIFKYSMEIYIYYLEKTFQGIYITTFFSVNFSREITLLYSNHSNSNTVLVFQHNLNGNKFVMSGD